MTTFDFDKATRLWVPFSRKDDAKSKRCYWNQATKAWYANEKNPFYQELIQNYSRIDLQIIYLIATKVQMEKIVVENAIERRVCVIALVHKIKSI